MQRLVVRSARAGFEKNKNKYRLLEYAERGGDDSARSDRHLEDGQLPATLIDVLHRVLWLMERHPSGLV